MKPTSFTMKTALLATLIISGNAMAQSLPDEINHPQYLRIYQNLEQVLNTKTAEFNNLSAQKAEIEKNISDMVRDQQAFPARNAELQRLIDTKRQDLSRIQSEMSGLEGILSKIIEDLRRIDAMVAQLQKDMAQESGRSQNIQARRAQVAQDVNSINARLQQEIGEENQSRQVLNNLTRGLDNDVQKRNEDVQARQNLSRDVERYKRELPGNKTKVAANVQASTAKKAQLVEAQGKLPAVKAQIASETAALAQADSEMAPSKAKLATLKAQLATQMPEVAKLQKENAALTAKIEANKVKITATGLTALVAKRDALENELSGTNTQISNLSAQIVAAKEAIKPDIGQLQEVKVKIRELERSGANPTELARLKLEAEAIEKRIAPKRLEIARMEKQYDNLLASIAPRNQELTNLKAQVVAAEASVANLLAENESAKNKIVENQKVIDERLATNSGLVKEINDLEAAIKGLQIGRDRIASNITQLKAQESTLTTQIAALASAVQQLDAETAQLSKAIAEMEKAIADFPLDMRRLENRIQKYDEQIQTAKMQIIREEKLLARIQQDRMALEGQSAAAQAELNRVNSDLQQSNQLIGVLQNKIQQETQNRDALTRYNQDSIRKYDDLKAQKANNEKIIADSTQEISVNNQDITTIAQELPGLRSDLSVITPKVASAENAMNDAQRKADDADAQYQSRIGLYQRYLSDAQGLGTERANIGTTDGVKAGAVDARTKATKLATENAAAEAKWIAIRRGFIRGEISGYDAGFDIGLSSSADASSGTNAGQIAGAKRAKDHANLVLKPEFFLAELDRRLMEDEVSTKKNMAFRMSDEIKTMASAKMVMRNDIPELTQEEIDASSRILSSLDAMIEQALIEANQVTSLRSRLADPRGVYTTPGAGENAANANCSGVYKNVKDFIDACKTTYGARYQGLYVSAHQESFVKEYGQTFSEQIIKTFDAELARLYPGNLKEATTVGNAVGVAAGKKEIYSQSFTRSENASFAANIQMEEARVEGEAIAMVGTYLNEGSALTLKGEAKLKGEATYGISPGSEVELKMLLKNIGAKIASNSILRITSSSPNLVIANRDNAVPAVAPKAQAEMAVMKLKVNDNAVPGSKVIIAGELVHAGNTYRASRVENFRVEAIVAVNPSVENVVDYDTTPKVANLVGIVKKHDIDFTVTPKFEGVEQGYEVSIEEVGSTYARFTNSKANTERLARGASKKMTFEYKLDKSARGKTINFKVTVKNAGAEVKTVSLQISAQ